MKVVVLGAGYAGVLTAKKLAAKKTGRPVEITLIDRNPFHTMLTELHEVAAWRVDESSIRIDLKKIFAGRRVNVVMDNIEKIDFAEKTLHGNAGSYGYDRLVLASGCKPTYWGIPGAEEHGFPLWSYDDAVRLREHIMAMFRGAAVETDPAKRSAMLNFYVIGTGFTGVEMAGELAEFVPFACEKFGIDRAEVKIHLLDTLDRIMPAIPKKITDKAMRRFAKTGVSVKLETCVVNLALGRIDYDAGAGVVSDSTRTVIWAAGTEGSDIALSSGSLGEEPGTKGRIRTDKFLRAENDNNVYVAGDNVFYIPEGETLPVPQMVENCEHCAALIAVNIAGEADGLPPQKEYRPEFHGAMVCIGGRYGIAHVGRPGRFVGLPSFIAMLAKHFVNMIYFVQVLGWNKLGSYIYHEFFTIRNRRSFVGGHFSNRTPSFLLVPLRLFTGVFFLYYAYRRYTLGWLETDVLGPYFESLRGVFRPSLFEFELWNQFRFSLFILNDHVHVWFQAMPFSLFIETFVLASEAHVMFWQGVIVVTTLLVGLALVGGLFTTLASFFVVAYAGAYILSGGLPFANMWLPFAGIALMFSGGRTLALDYYFMPWLKKKWKRVGWVKKSYLYND